MYKRSAIGQEQGLHEGLLGVQTVLRLVPDDRVRTVHQIGADFLTAVGGNFRADFLANEALQRPDRDGPVQMS